MAKGPGGRPRKPDHLKVVGGTAQPSRMNPNAPKPSKALPTPPEWLSVRGAEWFSKTVAILDGMGIASADHSDMLSLAATRYDEILDCTSVIEDLGRVFMTVSMSGSVVPKSRPEVAQRNEAMRHMQSLLSEFGLSPATVSKVSAPPGERENPFAEFS
jgi:P27 family predicted phage terminase small subunit